VVRRCVGTRDLSHRDHVGLRGDAGGDRVGRFPDGQVHVQQWPLRGASARHRQPPAVHLGKREAGIVTQKSIVHKSSLLYLRLSRFDVSLPDFEGLQAQPSHGGCLPNRSGGVIATR